MVFETIAYTVPPHRLWVMLLALGYLQVKPVEGIGRQPMT